MSDSNTPFEPATGPDFGGPFKTVCDHFEEHMKILNIDWEKKTLRFQVYGEHANMDVLVRVSEDDHILQYFITLPVRVSNEKMRPVVAEYLARAQYGLVVGCLETDMRDGEVRYHITHLMEDHAVGDMIVGRLFRTGMSTFDRYIPGLLQVIYGGNTPADAVYLCELDMHSSQDADTQSSSVAPKKKKPAPRRKKSTRKDAGKESGQESHSSDSGNQAALESPAPQDPMSNNQAEDRGTNSAESEEDEF